MESLLKETIKCLEDNGKTITDVVWVGTGDKWFSWGEFASIADFEYDSGYGGNEIKMNLVVVGKDFWLERHEYDGSEWWEFKTLPQKPAQTSAPLKEELLD